MAAGPDDAVASTATDGDLTGSVLAGCRLEWQLGRGAMGTVYRATHLALEKTVAVKVLHPSRFGEKRHVDQFFVEARAAASIEDPHIVAVHDVGEENGHTYIVMQFVEGDSLLDRLRQEGALEPAEATRIALAIARGLATAHGKGIVHRDIKPANVMLTKDGGVKIADFGLALRLSEDDEASVDPGIMGTPAYMSPEQIDGRSVDHRADLYSLGVTFYQMVTGEKPFVGETPMEVILKHMGERPVPARRRNPAVPEDLSRVIEKLMAREPACRYESAPDLCKDLEQILSGGKPQVVIAMESALQRMEALVRAEVRTTPSRAPLFAGMAAALSAALCVILFTVALPRAVPGAEALATAAVGSSAVLAEAEQAFRAAEELATRQPERILEIREALAALQNRYPPPWPSRVEALARDCEERYDQLARAAAGPYLETSARSRRDGHDLEALAALWEIPGQWLLGAAGPDVAGLRQRLEAGVKGSLAMAFVPPGSFLAGADSRKAELPAFLIDLTEVSNRAFEEFCLATGRPLPRLLAGDRAPEAQPDRPVVGVTFEDATAFAEWAGKRLPTALEWEKAARGTEGRVWPWGEQFVARHANALGFAGGVEGVNSRPEGASPFGCLHMAGNAHEWTSTSGSLPGTRVVKGGGWRSHPSNVRTFTGHPVEETLDDPALAVGFRCARDVR
jgi:serine/threonine-protein kinase